MDKLDRATSFQGRLSSSTNGLGGGHAQSWTNALSRRERGVAHGLVEPPRLDVARGENLVQTTLGHGLVGL